MIVEKIHRLTLVKKSEAMAKHPDTRRDVVEVVKATEKPKTFDEMVRYLLHKDDDVTRMMPRPVQKQSAIPAPNISRWKSGRWQ